MGEKVDKDLDIEEEGEMVDKEVDKEEGQVLSSDTVVQAGRRVPTNQI